MTSLNAPKKGKRTMQHDEADMVAALQSGDMAALHYCVERYQLSALRLAYNLCGDRQMAEDAVAESFLALVKYASSYDPSRPFHNWFYRIVVNCVRAAKRREGQPWTVPDARDLLRDCADPRPGPEIEVVQQESEQDLLRRVDRLPDRQREVVILRYYMDMNERTMSNVLGVPAGTIKWRLYQARKTLRRELEDAWRAHARRLEEVKESGSCKGHCLVYLPESPVEDTASKAPQCFNQCLPLPSITRARSHTISNGFMESASSILSTGRAGLREATTVLRHRQLARPLQPCSSLHIRVTACPVS